MLKRKMLEYLRLWRREKREECLLIKGARQVGKSYIVDQFGRSDYENYVALDFIRQPELKDIFASSLSAEDIYRQISLLVPGARFVDGKTLVFLDEIQECPEARAALKYLAQYGRYDVIASGSLLGISYREAAGMASIPVGYERSVTMRPLDFEEYLWARGYTQEATDSLRGYFDDLAPVPKAVNESMMNLYREYLAVGGMPAVVESFVSTQNFSNAHAAQEMLLSSYLDDIAKYATPTQRVKARACFTSLPRQLAKENTKFQYSKVERRGTARKFDASIDWLDGANMTLRCRAVSTPSFPLAAYEDEAKFRLYANDMGLLLAMYGFEMKSAVVGNNLKGPMKGGLYENLVACALASNGHDLRYWISSNGSREIEFLFDGPNATVVPVEVKSSRGSTVSLNELLARDDVERGYKLIDGNVGVDGKKITLPLYMSMYI